MSRTWSLDVGLAPKAFFLRLHLEPLGGRLLVLVCLFSQAATYAFESRLYLCGARQIIHLLRARVAVLGAYGPAKRESSSARGVGLRASVFHGVRTLRAGVLFCALLLRALLVRPSAQDSSSWVFSSSGAASSR